jgi:ankyrin repeat-rich membrane spanning protein
LYGTAIADTLSEPFLSMPIIVGMFAKWGSGKSFLLPKLKGDLEI